MPARKNSGNDIKTGAFRGGFGGRKKGVDPRKHSTTSSKRREGPISDVEIQASMRKNTELHNQEIYDRLKKEFEKYVKDYRVKNEIDLYKLLITLWQSENTAAEQIDEDVNYNQFLQNGGFRNEEVKLNLRPSIESLAKKYGPIIGSIVALILVSRTADPIMKTVSGNSAVSYVRSAALSASVAALGAMVSPVVGVAAVAVFNLPVTHAAGYKLAYGYQLGISKIITEESIRYYKNQLESNQKEGKESAFDYYKLGYAYQAMYYYKDAMKFYEKALSFYRDDNSQSLSQYSYKDPLAETLFHLGNCYYQLEEYTKTIEICEELLEYSRTKDIDIGMVHNGGSRDGGVEYEIYQTIASSYYQLGDMENSKKYYYKAIDFHHKSGFVDKLYLGDYISIGYIGVRELMSSMLALSAPAVGSARDNAIPLASTILAGLVAYHLYKSIEFDREVKSERKNSKNNINQSMLSLKGFLKTGRVFDGDNVVLSNIIELAGKDNLIKMVEEAFNGVEDVELPKGLTGDGIKLLRGLLSDFRGFGHSLRSNNNFFENMLRSHGAKVIDRKDEKEGQPILHKLQYGEIKDDHVVAAVKAIYELAQENKKEHKNEEKQEQKDGKEEKDVPNDKVKKASADGLRRREGRGDGDSKG